MKKNYIGTTPADYSDKDLLLYRDKMLDLYEEIVDGWAKELAQICDKDFDKNLEILILDDIFTTGSTFESMIEEFYKNGYKKITCLATASAN